MNGCLNSRSGMTLVEVAVALIVLGIVLAAVGPNLTGSLHRTNVDRVPNELQSDIRMAMSAAKSQSRTLRIVFSPNGYVIRDSADSTRVVQSRSYGSDTHINVNGDPLVFPWGLIQQTTVTVSGSGGTRNLTVLPTGRLENGTGL